MRQAQLMQQHQQQQEEQQPPPSGQTYRKHRPAGGGGGGGAGRKSPHIPPPHQQAMQKQLEQEQQQQQQQQQQTHHKSSQQLHHQYSHQSQYSQVSHDGGHSHHHSHHHHQVQPVPEQAIYTAQQQAQLLYEQQKAAAKQQLHQQKQAQQQQQQQQQGPGQGIMRAPKHYHYHQAAPVISPPEGFQSESPFAPSLIELSTQEADLTRRLHAKAQLYATEPRQHRKDKKKKTSKGIQADPFPLNDDSYELCVASDAELHTIGTHHQHSQHYFSLPRSHQHHRPVSASPRNVQTLMRGTQGSAGYRRNDDYGYNYSA